MSDAGPVTSLAPDDESRFWGKVETGTPEDCWQWNAGQDKDGYGQFTINRETHQAHRVSYALEKGDPTGELVLHTCDNPPCVNPRHLYLGDVSDNMHDAFDRGLKTLDGENNSNAKLTEDDVAVIRERVSNGETQAEVGDDFGIVQSTVSMIVSGDRWSNDDEDAEDATSRRVE